jgi:peptidoglycan/xylan/chitin deacetylase (PgdA/CDA1 family)
MNRCLLALLLCLPCSCTPTAAAVQPATTSTTPSILQAARPTDPIQVAITVDDLPRHGPDIPGVSRRKIHDDLLAVFAKHGLTGVYGFVNAGSLRDHPEDRQALVDWVSAGGHLGNHTFSHPHPASMTVEQYLAEVDANEALLRDLVGDSPEQTRSWKVFRYPVLEEGADLPSRAAIRAGLATRGYRIAQVTMDFYDWAYNGPYARCLAKGDVDSIAALKQDFIDHAAANLRWADAAARELVGRPVPQILLLHVGAFDAVMMDELLSTYEKNAAVFVTLEAALADPVYAEEPREPKASSGEFWNQVRKARGTRSPSLPTLSDTLLGRVCR